MPRAELLPPHMPSVGTAIPCLVAVVTRQPGVPQLQAVTSPPVLLARSKEGHQPPRGGTCCPQSALVGAGGGWGRGDEGPLGAGHGLVLKSRCGAGLPAHSPVTAGEEAAPAPCGGEVTLEALVLGSRHDAGGAPSQQRANARGGENRFGCCLPAQRGVIRALRPLSSSVCSGERAKGGNDDKHRPQTALHPWKVLLGPYGLAANGHFSTQHHSCRSPPLLLAARGPLAPVLPAQASLAGFPSVPAGTLGAAGMEQGLSPSPPAGTSRAVDFSSSADYGSEVNSHVAKLPLLWER